MWLDGKNVFEKNGLGLWSGDVYPKFGIYRGEKGDHDTAGETNVFDLWVYKVQVSDSSLGEVSGASGLGVAAIGDVINSASGSGSAVPLASGMTTSYKASASAGSH